MSEEKLTIETLRRAWDKTEMLKPPPCFIVTEGDLKVLIGGLEKELTTANKKIEMLRECVETYSKHRCDCPSTSTMKDGDYFPMLCECGAFVAKDCLAKLEEMERSE